MLPNTFVTTLLDWYSDHARDLPWRHTSDPYAIWLSEIIMQQTRVAQGQAYWERFMNRWPTVEQLAEASEDEVLRLWQGLGYYSRARNLHAAARQIVALGHFPDTIEEIRQLKGVGNYTAAAIAAFAFGLPAAAVDGNFYRVLARIFGIDTPISSGEGKREFQALADELLRGSGPSAQAEATMEKTAAYEQADIIQRSAGRARTSANRNRRKEEPTLPALFNSAMMDFGALQCTPKSPACHRCPFCEQCVALRQGRVDKLPVKPHNTTIKTIRMDYLYLRCREQVAMRRRGEGDIWQGLWEPVLLNDPSTPCGLKATAEKCARLIAQNVKHQLTHRTLLADFRLLDTDKQPDLPQEYVWIAEQEIDRHAIPRLVEILLERLRDAES